jgi:arylsulfatase
VLKKLSSPRVSNFHPIREDATASATGTTRGWARAAAVAAVAFAWAPASGQEAQRGEIQPNILLIVLDDVGTDKLEIYGESESPTYAQAPYCGMLTDPLPYPRTPNITALANGTFPGLAGGGIRFQRAYGAPVCCPARACIQTGRYGFRSGSGILEDGGALRKRLNNAEVLLPELLRKGFSNPTSPASLRRYRCGAFGKWHLTGLPVCDPVLASDFAHPVLNGFHVFQGTVGNVGTGSSNPGDHFNWTKATAVPGAIELTRYAVGSEELIEPFQFSSQCTVPGTKLQTTTYSEENFSASVTRADAVGWINAQRDPFFAYVAFNPPHFPNQVPPLTLLSPETQAELQDEGNAGGPYCAGQIAGTSSACGTSTCTDSTSFTANQKRIFYGAMLEAVDTEIGNLLAQMSPDKRARTMVFVIADNGTPATAVEPLLHDPDHAKGELYELGIRVPMIASGYLVPPGGHASDALVHAVDLWKTFAQISGASPALAAPQQTLDSVGFTHVLRDPGAASLRDELFCQTFVQPGAYFPTDWGPYKTGCTDRHVPGVYYCVPKNVGQHGRSLNDGQYKLILIQTTAGAEVAPPGTPDVQPLYDEELYDILADPGETTDLMPLIPGDPTLTAIRDQLRDRLTQLSGY